MPNHGQRPFPLRMHYSSVPSEFHYSFVKPPTIVWLQKISIPRTEGFFGLHPLPPRNFSSKGSLMKPPSPWNFYYFLVWTALPPPPPPLENPKCHQLYFTKWRLQLSSVNTITFYCKKIVNSPSILNNAFAWLSLIILRVYFLYAGYPVWNYANFYLSVMYNVSTDNVFFSME